VTLGQDRAQARTALLRLLSVGPDDLFLPSKEDDVFWLDRELAEELATFAGTAEDLARAHRVMLGLIARATDGFQAARLTAALAGLGQGKQGWARARKALLRRLPRERESRVAWELAEALAGLDPTEHDWARARKALLGRLARETDGGEALGLVESLARLTATAESVNLNEAPSCECY
jgi:hypothetical protein